MFCVVCSKDIFVRVQVHVLEEIKMNVIITSERLAIILVKVETGYRKGTQWVVTDITVIVIAVFT